MGIFNNLNPSVKPEGTAFSKGACAVWKSVCGPQFVKCPLEVTVLHPWCILVRLPSSVQRGHLGVHSSPPLPSPPWSYFSPDGCARVTYQL